MLELSHQDTGMVIERIPASSINVSLIYDRVLVNLREPYAPLQCHSIPALAP